MKFDFRNILPILGALGMIALAAIFTKKPTTLPPALLIQPSPRLITKEVASSSGNFIQNPGFEDNPLTWFSMPSWNTQFELSSKQVHSGTQSALLQFDSDTASSQSGEIHGVVQEILPGKFPEKISGWYYVEDWETHTAHQYLQFVVIVFDAKNIPPMAASSKNHQIRFLLAGENTNPFEIRNAKFVFHNKNKPQLGHWVYFERNIKQDFIDQWGSVPEGYSNIRLFFEARWDGRKPGEGRSAGTVYYDDLFVGTAQ